MSDYKPTSDRSLWPEEARAIAEDPKFGLTEEAIFHRVINWPVSNPFEDYIELPKQPRGVRTFRWIPCHVHAGERPNQRVFLFAIKWPERQRSIQSGATAHRDVRLSTEVDETEAVVV